ncbi:hypothetical protein Ddc_03366 [Ditylenchus destructor]|nr:hypothetical protein Ddc_03366 [Ditylenchus destructor]
MFGSEQTQRQIADYAVKTLRGISLCKEGTSMFGSELPKMWCPSHRPAMNGQTRKCIEEGVRGSPTTTSFQSPTLHQPVPRQRNQPLIHLSPAVSAFILLALL